MNEDLIDKGDPARLHFEDMCEAFKLKAERTCLASALRRSVDEVRFIFPDATWRIPTTSFDDQELVLFAEGLESEDPGLWRPVFRELATISTKKK